MRVRPAVLFAALPAAAVTALLSIGCGSGSPVAQQQKPAEAPDANVGDPLYKAQPDVVFTAAPAKGGEPLVIPNCSVQYEDRQQVASEVDGKIDLLAYRDPDIDANDPNCVYHPRDKAKQVKYRLIKEGQLVKAGWEICFLDDQVVSTQIEVAVLTRDAAKVVEQSAIEGVELTKKKTEISKKAWADKTGSFVDYLQDMITLTRFEENRAQALQTIAKAEGDHKQAQVMLGKHRIRSTVNGVVRNIAKRSGEFVKAGEKILEIQATDTVRLEGKLDAQYYGLVKPGMAVTVEPAVPSSPVKSHDKHVLAVTGVAVTAHPDRPLVVSAAADGTVRVWDVTRDAPIRNLLHLVPVRSVACSPPGVKPEVAVTGSEDGKVRVWDLSNPDKLPAEPKELADTHAAAVGAIAFSPDGKFAATAAGRNVMVWDAVGWKKLYDLPAEHRDTITCLQFTPQCTLVTAAKDRSLKVWKLGAERGAVVKTIDHRAGAVDVLGVTKDGSRVVFDQDKNRLDLLGLADRQTAGQVQNVESTAAFATLAVFSPNDALLLTAGGEGELKGGLQVWTVPATGGRGTEAARLFTPGRQAVTAAAFSPAPAHPFLVVGTDHGAVHLWTPPEARKPTTGKVVYLDSTDPRYVNVRVEMDNKELKLLDRSSATVIINPGR